MNNKRINETIARKKRMHITPQVVPKIVVINPTIATDRVGTINANINKIRYFIFFFSLVILYKIIILIYISVIRRPSCCFTISYYLKNIPNLSTMIL